MDELPLYLLNDIYCNLSLREAPILMAINRSIRRDMRVVLMDDIHRALFEYKLDPRNFRRVMRETGAVLAGLTALQMVLTEQTGGSSLDVFVDEEGAEKIESEVRRHGYAMQGDGGRFVDQAIWTLPIQRLVRYIREDQWTDKKRRINVFVTKTGETIHPLAKMDATALMTYVASDSIHVPFPQLTFARRAIIPLRGKVFDDPELGEVPRYRMSPSQGNHVKGLEAMGFELAWRFSWEGEKCGTACGVAANRFKSPAHFGLVFDPRGAVESAFYGEDGCGFKGRDIHFYLRGRCYNKDCSNWDEVWMMR